jgi:hypothetical protein
MGGRMDVRKHIVSIRPHFHTSKPESGKRIRYEMTQNTKRGRCPAPFGLVKWIEKTLSSQYCGTSGSISSLQASTPPARFAAS